MIESAPPALVALEVADGVGTIRLQNGPLNVLSNAVALALADLAEEAERRNDVRSVVVTGSDRAFAAGGDIREMAAMGASDMDDYITVLQRFAAAIAEISKPTVSAISGFALGGGCELALCTDVRFASEDARIGLPEITLGIIPGAGGTQRLARLIGAAKAKQLIFTGRILTADEALDLGIVDEVTPKGEVYPRALEWARSLAAGPGLALSAAKRAIDRGCELTLSEGLRLEVGQIVPLFATEDQRIGMHAFLHKTTPVFGGR